MIEPHDAVTHEDDSMQPQDPLQRGQRFDAQGRRLCGATSRRSGKLCRSPAMNGQEVCRMHGGSTKQAKAKAKLRLMELVDPAIAVLAREMSTADKSADKQRAANSILDRAGFGRQQQVDVEDARTALLHQILEARGQSVEEYDDEE